MMTSSTEFDEFYSVSDLHMGGGAGYQIFSQGETLAALVESVRQRAARKRVVLALNGDIVDYLAEQPFRYLDALGAPAKFARILQDAAFAEVWKTLGNFVRTPRAHLVFVLGNHDVELALPSVREVVRDCLCGSDEQARGRLAFAMDGAGYRCRIGGAEVFCCHGNEMDPFNVVDYGALRETATALNRGMPVPDWSPNAGTRLVIDVMNELKRKFRWVDLLKPEVEAVIPTLLAADPSSLALLRKFTGIGLRAAAELRTRDPDRTRRAWAYASLLELALLELRRPRGAAPSRRVDEMWKKFCQEAPPGSPEWISTDRQLRRYAYWWTELDGSSRKAKEILSKFNG